MRMLPFFKPKNGYVVAGGGLDTEGGGGGSPVFENDFYHNGSYSLSEGQDYTDVVSHTVTSEGYYLVGVSFVTNNSNVKTRITIDNNTISDFLSNARHYDTLIVYLSASQVVKIQVGMNTYDQTTLNLSAGLIKLHD